MSASVSTVLAIVLAAGAAAPAPAPDASVPVPDSNAVTIVLDQSDCRPTSDPEVQICTDFDRHVPWPYASVQHDVWCPVGLYLAWTSTDYSPGRKLPRGVHVDEHNRTGVAVGWWGPQQLGFERYTPQPTKWLIRGAHTSFTNYAMETRRVTINLHCTANKAKAARGEV